MFSPALCTDELQPLDVADNKPFALRQTFNEWNSDKISEALESGITLLKPRNHFTVFRCCMHSTRPQDKKCILLNGSVDLGLSQDMQKAIEEIDTPVKVQLR